MCLIAYLILGLIAGWFVASQGVGNSGASDFRPPPPQIFRPPYDSHPHHRRNPCPRGKLYVPGSVSPEILEPVWGQSRVNRRARDRTVSEPPLNRPGIMPPVGQRVAARMAKHVGVDHEGHAGPLAEALDQGMEALRRHRRATLRDEHVRARRLSALQPAQRPQFVALERMD
jgi:hypothetical protein